MPIQPPHPPANIAGIQPPQDPPTIQDVTNAIKYVEEIKAGYREFGYPTAEDLAIAYTYRSMVINARTETAVAPPWFNEAMTLRSTLQLLEDRMDQIQVELRETTRTTNKVYNMQCRHGQVAPYKIVPFLDGSSPPNDHGLPALHTAQDIRDLDQQDVQSYMRGYGLHSNFEDHRPAIAVAIGCSEYR